MIAPSIYADIRSQVVRDRIVLPCVIGNRVIVDNPGKQTILRAKKFIDDVQTFDGKEFVSTLGKSSKWRLDAFSPFSIKVDLIVRDNVFGGSIVEVDEEEGIAEFGQRGDWGN